MGAYNFQDRFVPDILAGRKRHTIRGHRKNPDEPGDTLYLFNRQRTKRCRRLMDVLCVRVENILIREVRNLFKINVGGVELDDSEMNTLAQHDGFPNITEMWRFWRRYNTLPFSGQIIHWRYDGKSSGSKGEDLGTVPRVRQRHNARSVPGPRRKVRKANHRTR